MTASTEIDPAGTFQSQTCYRTHPATVFFGQKPGILRMNADRLSFVQDDGTVRFDAPLATVHSVWLAEMDSALDLWVGSERHRIVMSDGTSIQYVPPMLSSTSAVGAALAVPAAIQDYRNMKAAAKKWKELLDQRVGSPPPGVKVRRPLGKFAYMVTGFTVAFGLAGAVFALVWIAAG